MACIPFFITNGRLPLAKASKMFAFTSGGCFLDGTRDSKQVAKSDLLQNFRNPWPDKDEDAASFSFLKNSSISAFLE